MTARALPPRALPVLALLSALAVLALLVGFALLATGGAFEYPLDDPYIHLALAEQIAHGTYGVNPGEVASPGSSPIYPFLLVPFAGTSLQRYVPLFWNTLGLGLTAWIWGVLLTESGYVRPGWRGLGLAAAALGPFALLMPQVAFVGMEHELHAAAALAVVLGLYRHFSGSGSGRGLALVIVGAFLASCLRFEGMALALFAGIALFVTGSRRAGLMTALAGFVPIAIFAVFLASLGLNPLPSSVQAKLADGTVAGAGGLAARLYGMEINLLTRPGELLAALAGALLLMARLVPALRGSRLAALAFTVAAAAAAHLVAGQMGWKNRYEHYIMVASVGTLLALLPTAIAAPRPGRVGVGAAALLFVAFIGVYQPLATAGLPRASEAVHAQQYEMGRFVKDYLHAPVAVNDIGLVSWQNPNYVLDLWGLASAEADALRHENPPPPGWAAKLAAREHVPAAMVYQSWIGVGIGKNWTKLGELQLTRMIGYLGGPRVSFYATTPEEVAPMRAAIEAWKPGLGPLARWVWADGMAP